MNDSAATAHRRNGSPARADRLELDRVIRGDCLNVLGTLPAAFANLAYLDPPFNTGKVRSGRKAEFQDRWPDVTAYLAFLKPRVQAIHRSLTASGSILLHCDWRTSHHIRLMLDEIFGEDQFINHLIWSYGLGGSSPRRFARKHDDIFFYAKSQAYHFSPPMIPATSARMRGEQKKATDVLDIPSINNMATERVGYPTQKPLALLTMLVQACCPPGGVVLDSFCGSGTTLVAAQKTGRRFIGIDASRAAVTISTRRLHGERSLNGRHVSGR